MVVRARLLRLLGAMCLLVGVFFAAFFVAVALRQPISQGSLARVDSTQDTLVAETQARRRTSDTDDRASVAPRLSEPAVPVATTTTRADAAAPALIAGALEVPNFVSSSTTSTTTTEPEAIDPLDIDPLFAPIHDTLARALEIPVRLPQSLSEQASGWVPSIGAITPASYIVHLDDSADCDGTSACRVSTFIARRSTSATPELPAGTPVPLPNGMSGVFIDSSCGAGCNKFIIWIEDNVRYSVGTRLGSGPDVLDLAWRSIDSALPTPAGPELCGPGAPKHDGTVARTITTTVDDERQMHWVVVCSELGLDLEIIESPGEVQWADVDADGTYNAVVRHEDETSTIFAIYENRPLGVIDAATGERLVVSDLACARSKTGEEPIAIDRSTGEHLDFVNPTTVRRIAAIDLPDWTIGDC